MITIEIGWDKIASGASDLDGDEYDIMLFRIVKITDDSTRLKMTKKI